MGNLESITLSLALHQDDYTPGEEVHGLLNVDVAEDVEVAEVFVRLSGELVRFSRKHERDSTEINKDPLFDPDLQSVGKIAETTLPPGEYQVPFVAKLPEGLDPSVLIADGSHVTGVSYNICVLAQLPEDEELYRIASKEVEVVLAHEEDDAEVEATTVASITQLGFSVGHLEVTGKLSKRNYRYGDKVQLSYAIKNESKWDVKHIRVMLETIYKINDDEKCSRHQLLQIPERVEAGEEHESAGECLLEFESGTIQREDLCVENYISIEPVIAHRTVDPLKIDIATIGRGEEDLKRPDLGLRLPSFVYTPIESRLESAESLLTE